MKAPKSCILLVAALTVSSNVRVWAGPQSLLDPYSSVQAPGSKNKVSKTKASKANKSEDKAEEKAEAKKSSTRSALSSSEGEEEKPLAKVDKPVQSEKKTHVAKEKGKDKADKPLATGSSDGGVVSGINDIKKSYVRTFKAAGSGIVNGTKAAGAKVADGGKKVKDGFMNGAKAIGHGMKLPSGKSKNASDGANTKVASAPHKSNHSQKSEAIESASAGSGNQDVGEKVLDDASYPGKPLEPLSAKPLAKASGKSAGPGVMGRTFGKFNVFGHAKKQQPSLPAPRAASDPNQPFPN